MRLPTDRHATSLPKRFPVGARYVIEGSGGEDGRFRVFSRYVVLPGGQRINVPADLAQPVAPQARGRRQARGPAKARNRANGRPLRGRKNFFARAEPPGNIRIDG
jgi:hypothetical protein